MINNFFLLWTTADWVNITLSIFLFIAGAWVTRILSVKQERTLKEIRDLQEATAELQIREKIGVIAGKINAIEMAKGKQASSAENLRFVLNVWQDGLSVLPLFKFASERLQIQYRDVLAHTLYVFRKNKHYRIQLEGMYNEIGEHVAKLNNEGLECATILKGAIILTKQGLRLDND